MDEHDDDGFPPLTPNQRAYLAAFDAWLHGAWKQGAVGDGLTHDGLTDLKDAALSHMMADPPPLHRCWICGTEILDPAEYRRRYCDECRRERRRDVDNRSQRRRHALRKEREAKRKG